MDVLVTGSHGFIGTALLTALRSKGHTVRRLVRGEPTGRDVRWDLGSRTIDKAALEGIEGVVHLAGAGIGDHRWTEDHKRAVLESRTVGTTLLAEALAGLKKKPAVLVSGSAVGFYGDRGDEQLTEESSGGTGFLADVVRQWEASTAAAEQAGIRVVHARTGIVLSGDGGALKKQLLPFKLGLGGRLGSGRQYVSWITLHDEVMALLHCLTTDSLNGPVNLTSPNPVPNSEFTKALGAALHRPTVVPIPTFAVKALFGAEMTEEMLLPGQRVMPTKLEETGFTFKHPDIREAMRAVLG